MMRMKRPLLGHFPHVLFGAAFNPLAAFGQTADLLPEMVVLAERAEPGPVIAEWDREDLSEAAPRTIDELLAREPSFSLYRRQSSVFGNPTSAGVSLRNTGATAASRTLVLLDGIPQNDPFGGWIYWARYDAAALDSVRIVPSSRSAVWGNQSPAGVIQMAGREPFQNEHALRVGGGSQGSFGGSVFSQITDAEKRASVTFSAFGFQTDGFYALDSSQRGPIDEKLHTDLWGTTLRGAWLAAPGLTVEPMVSYYTEDRGNGTSIAGNSTEAIDLSLRVTLDDGDRSWQFLAYHQRREFEAKFASVDATRTTETLALDQYDVPGLGTGGAFTMRWTGGDAWDITAGADVRVLTGETHENAGTFRNRVAGGDQAFEGIFANAGYRIDGSTRIDAGARLDFWQLYDGRRVETSLVDGSNVRDDRPDDRDGIEPSASIELTRQLRDDLEARVSTGTAFRLPTLNELYRPFRVRDDIVEANADLDPERFVSIEGGLEWKPRETVTFDLAVFHHWIRDAIANVPVTDPAEIAELFGTIPPGGSGSQRRNVDEATVTGVEAKAEWLPHEQLTIALTGLWTETEFRDSRTQPLLEGQPFPQAPDLRVIGDIEWQATESLGFFAGAEYGASQYDDALATRRIPDYTSVRVGAWFRHLNGLYQIRVENLFDEEIQTGLSSDGLRTYAAPRSVWIGAEWGF
jgi:outer membrane cobalamin receptor